MRVSQAHKSTKAKHLGLIVKPPAIFLQRYDRNLSMAEWRDRGFVPDSDDEDEATASNDTQAPRPIDPSGSLATKSGDDSDADFRDIEDLDDIGGNETTHGSTAIDDPIDTEKDTYLVKATASILSGTTSKIPSSWDNEEGSKVLVQVVETEDDIDDELQLDHYAASAAAQIEAELNYEARRVEEKVGQIDGYDTVLSSPLTEPPSTSPSLSPEPPRDGTLPSSNYSAAIIFETSEAQCSLSRKDAEGAARVAQINETYEEHRPLRALRQRNPIQVHPYAVESEMYRQTLKARGLKPLRIAQGQTETRVEEEGDPEEREFNAGEEKDPANAKKDMQDHIQPATSVRVVVPATTAYYHSNVFTVEGDDLPDVDAVLRHAPTGISAQGYKRRKITHTFSKRPRMLSKESDQIRPARSDPHQGENGTSPDGFDDDHIYDVPHSPPLSGSSASLRLSESDNHGFRFPLGIPPQPLQTPATSSESGKRMELLQLETTDSEEEQGDGEQNEESQGSTESDSSDSEKEVSHELERVQRKIRGVLPASWLKLDMKSHVEPDKRAVTDFHRTSPIKNGMQRGVARPASRSKGWSPRVPNEKEQAIVLSDSSDLENESPGASAEQTGRTSGLQDDDDEDDDEDSDADFPMLDPWGDLEEDNRIDAILPAAQCTNGQRGHKQPTKSHLIKGNGTRRQRPTDRGLFQKSKGSYSHQPKITDHLGRKPAPALKQAKFRPPKLSILDATTTPPRKQDVIPNFLRLAARTVRSRKDKGRHSPSGKFIRLARREDTEEACGTLRDWREGTLAPAARISDSHSERQQLVRGPLRVRSGNAGGPARKLTQPEQSWKESFSRTDSGETRQTHRNNQSRGRQSLLDHIKQGKLVATSSMLGQGNKAMTRIHWKKNGLGWGQLITSLQATGAARPAMLESLQLVNDHDHPQATFQRTVTRISRKRSTRGVPNVLLERFLKDEGVIGVSENANPRSNEEDIKILESVATLDPQSVPHLARKRRPRHVDIEEPSYRQPSVPILIEDDSAPPFAGVNQEQTALYGLGPFGTHYTTTFDITALPSSTSFHENTLVGSGEFSKSLGLPLHRDIDREAGSMSLDFTPEVFIWGSWNEAVSSQVGLLFERISHGVRTAQSGDSITANQYATVHVTLAAMKSIIRYINNYLNFSDPVDRISCLQRCKVLVGSLLNELEDEPRDVSPQGTEESKKREIIKTRIATYALVVLNQLAQIAQHELVDSSLVSEIERLVLSTAQRILTGVIKGVGLREVRRSLDKLRFHATSDVGLRDDEFRIEALLVVYHIIRQKHGTPGAFWEQIRGCGFAAYVESNDCRLLDRVWQVVFTLLPLLEFNSQGVLTAVRFENSTDGWTLVKELISNVLQNHLSNTSGQSSTFNAYCRALLGRCFVLIKRWGWSRCESIIETLFDFFARNGLCHLRNEEAHGSSRFLEHLDQNQILELEHEDRSFHIFLKITGLGLQKMRKIYSDKKIRDIMWRLIPNHGRQHPKDEAIRKDDLDALRNHHDLLCTLYWGSPPGFRPRLDAIRNLVHLESSHREACHINIKAWSNLVKFQLSVDEPLTSLEPFADWYRDLWTQSVRQHLFARTEAEAQVRSAVLAGHQAIPKEILESTIARNQRQVEAILGDALSSLKSAINAARNSAAAKVLLTPTLSDAFGLFDARQTRFNMVIMQALDVVLSFTQQCTLVQPQERFQAGTEDSQDYGDWSAFEENDEDQIRRAAAVHLHETIHKPLSHLLSNVFGAEVAPDSPILLKTIDAWATTAQVLVGQGIKTWDHYVSQYGQDSWKSLRNTEQTRKYTAYFLSTVIEKEPDCYREHKAFFLTSWVASLAERESLLKYQHRYTAAILNADLQEPILKNLPFWTDRNTGRFEVSPQDFRERRMSLISCLLSNIRQSLGEASYYQLAHASQLRHEYRDLLKHLMAVMKKNYQELGGISNVRGAYVTFVQQVVQYMQQHTADICPIDQFFIDSTAFPLPATDPTYVVGRLKNYGLRLQESGTPKKLAMFIQAVSERAAIDRQQLYLIDQLHVAMSNSFEDGDATRPTLRAFLVKAIFPAYIELAFSTASGWILADPILQALSRVFRQLLEDVDGVNRASVASITSTFAFLFASMQTSMELLIDHSGLLEQPTTLRTLTSFFSMVASALPSLDYMVRLSKSADSLVPYVTFFKSFALFAAATVLGNEDTPLPYVDTSGDEPAGLAYAEMQQFTLHELRETLSKSWAFHDGRYYLVRGNIRKEVVIELGSYAEEKALLIEQIEDFVDMLENMPSLGEYGQMYVSTEQKRWIGMDEAYF
ncbi:Methyl methanesulphonate-sensitivity protein 22 [Lasallia pustulata]|uniref:Methyl methanesulphonate-sensitivity protein 22 n=1 Tax=Lasallia pustulata TaxID=136370 RepID=A0A1W5CUY1_9LECA|nr:Methyl methanesulphonate-sensitivity protein 22 [Lasallia pustulata]